MALVVSDALRTSAGLRCPVFDPATAPRTKITELESYTLLSAFTQGELSEERLLTLVELAIARRKWDHLGGWEGLKRTRTEAAVQDAKRQVDPELYDCIQDLEWRVKRLTEEIARLEGDAAKVSRAYSMITGT